MAVEENIITWNVTNWVTVTVIALISFAAIGFVQSYYNKKSS